MPLLKDNTQLLLFGQHSERLDFRSLNENDFDTWLSFCEDEASLKYIWPGGELSGKEKCEKWFERIFYRYNNHMGGLNALINRSTGELVGQCGLLVQTVDDVEELEIGYSLMPQHRGRGYALEAAKKCRDVAFEKSFCDSLISIIHVENVASEHVALNNGMHRDKRTVYQGFEVNVFRIHRSEWIK